MLGLTIAEISVGQSASYTKTITEKEVAAFGELVGDFNPVHFDEEYAKTTMFKTRIAHGMLGASLLSSVLAMHLPGPGGVYLKQDVKFLAPVFFGDTLTATVIVKEKIEEKNRLVLDCKVTNQNGVDVIVGEALVMPRKET